jgi:predicted amidohydrolase
MDQGANRIKGEAFCRQAGQMGADIALFPEMWSIGYTHWATASTLSGEPVYSLCADPTGRAAMHEARGAWQAQAIEPDGPFVAHFRRLAQELGMAIALTYLEKWPGAPRNSVSLIDRHGNIVMTYAKVHTCVFDEGELEAACTPGDDFSVCTLDTASGAVRVGAMICYDREFPESARILMLKGAELILTPNACPLEENRIGQFRARAFENMVAVAMTNYAAPQKNGHSVAFDPEAFDTAEQTRDTLVVEAGEGEGVYIASFNLDKLRAYRAHGVWGNAFRRPQCYGLLTSPPTA